MKGIDVSYAQGKIDWEQLKGQIDFAVIRMGYGSDIRSQDDQGFERNVSECERLGIPWGSYLYSYALSEEEAYSEAAHAIRLLKEKKPTFPIWYDMEDADNYKKKRKGLNRDKLIKWCEIFCSELEQAGYYVGIYASVSWFDRYLNSNRLDRYDKWVAHWAKSCGYSGKYGMWQYTSQGKVNGIFPLDCNLAYQDYPSIIKKAHLNYW